MATAEQEAINSGIQISKLHQDVKTQKAKERSKAGDIAIKKATLVGSMPTEEGTMGEGLMAGANRMAQNPHQNAWTGLIEGLMRGFGMGLKGKEAAEKRKQVEEALEVLNYAMEGQEYLQGVQSQLAERKGEQKLLPSQQQITQAYENGTLEPTVKALLRQQGVDPNNVTFSSDGHSVFIKKGEQIIQKPVSDFFGQQDSQAFDFANNVEKSNFARSENKVIQGLAQENNTLKSQNTSLTTLLSNIPGLDPQAIQALNAQAEAGKAIEKQKLGNETMTAEARDLSSKATWNRSQYEKELKPLQAQKLQNEVSLQEVEKKMGFNKGMLTYLTDQRDDLKGVDQEYQQYQELKDLLHTKDEKGNLIKDEAALAGWFGIERPDWMKNPKQARMAQIKSDLTGSHFKKMGYRNKQEYEKIRTIDSKYGWDENMKVIEDNMRILKPLVEEKKSLDATLKKAMEPILVKAEERNTITLKKNGKTDTIPTTDYEASKKLAEAQGFEVVK
jgi:hypothetical protein